MPKNKTKKSKTLPYVIARCSNAGVHAGELVRKKLNGNGTASVELRNSRRIWYWTGAASLSELAVYGSKNIGGCKIAVPLAKMEVMDCCEIDYTQPAGEKALREAPEWRA